MFEYSNARSILAKLIKFNILFCLLMTQAVAWAGSLTGDTVVDVPRPPAVMFTAEAGYGRVLDTYLTPITYTGWHTALGYEHTQATGFSPDRWVRQLSLGMSFDHVKNPVGNHSMQHLRAGGRWALMRRWTGILDPRLSLMAGGMTWLQGGAIYNSGNSNNVVSVKAHWTLGLQGMAQYSRKLSCCIGRS